MGDSNYQQVLRKYAARVDDYQNIYSTGTLSQCNSPLQKAKAYYNWLPSPTLTRENAEELIKQAEPYWLIPKLTRNQVISLLFDKPHGSFLVRESSSANCYALSVRLPTDEPPVKHYLIECIPNGYAIQGSGLPFPTISKLLAYFCFSTSGGMPCFLRPPMLPDAESSTDYTPMSDIYGQEQNNLQGAPVMGWTSSSDSAANVVRTDMHPVSSSPWKPDRHHLEPLEISVSMPPQLPPRANKWFKDQESRRKMPRSILLQGRDDTIAAEPYAVIPIGRKTEPKPESTTPKSDSVPRGQSIKRAPHIYDEIDFETPTAESELKQRETTVPAQGSRPESEEESPYAEPNIYSDDDEMKIPNYVVTPPPPLPPRAPSMTPPCSPKPASTSSPVHSDDDDYIEPEVIDHVKPNRSHSAPPSQFFSVLNGFNSKDNYTNHPITPTSPPKSPKSPKSPKAAKEKKPKKGGTLYNILRTFKKKPQAETVHVTRILPEHIPSDDVSLYQNSVNKYNLDLPNVGEDKGSELQRRLSKKSTRSSKQGTLTRHRSLSPMDAYVDMHPESRPLSNCDYYEPMQLQELRQQFLLKGEYDIPYVSPSPSPTSDEERTDNNTTDNTTGNTTGNTTVLRKSKSESSLAVDEPSRTSALGITLLTQMAQSTDCVINDEMPEDCDTNEVAKSVDHRDTIKAAKSVDQVDHSAAVEVKQPLVPPRLQKPPIGPKPQLKPKPLLPPKPNHMVTRPTVLPRTKALSQYGSPKLPPKPAIDRSKSTNKSELTTHNDVVNNVVTRTNADIRVPEEVGDNDRKILKPLGKAPPPPPPKNYRSTSFIMVKKPPPAKGAYAPTSPSSDGSKENGSFSPVKSPTALTDKTEEDRKKEEVGLVVELKESDDDELEHVEYTVDNTNTTEQALTTSTEVDGTVGVQESSSGKKRKKNKKTRKNWSPFTFLHKKPAEQKIKEFILQLSLNKNTTFGTSLAQFLSTTRHEVADLSYQQLLSNIRSYIDSAREKLQKEYGKELIEHGMKGCQNFDVLLEKVLQDVVVQPLQQLIQYKIEKHFLETGSLQQLQRNITAAKLLASADLGIRDHLIPPGSQAIEEARKLFDQMQRVHSAFSKMELLLQAVRITYDNVQDVVNKNKSSRGLGADDFLPVFIWMLVHADFCKAEVEAEYMWGLVHPSLLNGEGGYYLTTLTSAVNVLKETQFGAEDNQEASELPGMDDSQAFLCVCIEEIDGCTCEPPISKVLPIHASMTVEQACALISETLAISNPEAYGLYAITSSSEKLLEKDQCPQKIKHDLLAKHQSGRFVYKTV